MLTLTQHPQHALQLKIIKKWAQQIYCIGFTVLWPRAWSQAKLSWWLLMYSWKAVWEGRWILFSTVALDLACLCLIWIQFELTWILIPFDLNMSVNCLWKIRTEMTSQLALNISSWNWRESWTSWKLNEHWFSMIFIWISRKVTKNVNFIGGQTMLLISVPACFKAIRFASLPEVLLEIIIEKMQLRDHDFFEVRFRKNPAGKTSGKKMKQKHNPVGILYCGGGLLICPGSWLTLL